MDVMDHATHVLTICDSLVCLFLYADDFQRATVEIESQMVSPAALPASRNRPSGRPNPALSVRQPADPDDFKLTLEFIQYISKAAMQYAADT